MTIYRKAGVFKHLQQLYHGHGPKPFAKKRKGAPPQPDRRWAREALDALLRRPHGKGAR